MGYQNNTSRKIVSMPLFSNQTSYTEYSHYEILMRTALINHGERLTSAQFKKLQCVNQCLYYLLCRLILSVVYTVIVVQHVMEVSINRCQKNIQFFQQTTNFFQFILLVIDFYNICNVQQIFRFALLYFISLYILQQFFNFLNS